MVKYFKENTEYLINSKFYLRKIFLLLFYNGFIEGEYHFIFDEPLYSNIDDDEMEKVILDFFERTEYNNRLNNLILSILCTGIDEEYKNIVEKYK